MYIYIHIDDGGYHILATHFCKDKINFVLDQSRSER